MANSKQDMNNALMEASVLRGAVENTNEAFVTIDRQSTVIFFNKAAEKIFGYPRQEVVGRNLALILAPECRSGHDAAVSRFLRTGETTLIGHETELTAMRHNGEPFPASISFSVAEVEGQLYFTGVVRDLTETKKLQDRLLQSERLAALGQMVAEINHEIKNPLLMIGGFARQLLKTVQSGKDQDKLRIMAEEVERLEHLLSELRDLYRPRSLTIEKIDLSAFLEEIHAMVRPDSAKRGIAVALNLEPADIVIEGDRQKLKQVLLNVIKNGIEAMRDGGTLAIEAQQGKDAVEITVTDAGPGIPDMVREKMFTPFFTTKKHGTGLGLCLSKRIIEEHAGSALTVTSREGRGTRVTITLAQACGNSLKNNASPG